MLRRCSPAVERASFPVRFWAPFLSRLASVKWWARIVIGVLDRRLQKLFEAVASDRYDPVRRP